MSKSIEQIQFRFHIIKGDQLFKLRLERSVFLKTLVFFNILIPLKRYFQGIFSCLEIPNGSA